MTQEELEQLLKSHGWYIAVGMTGKQKDFAAKRRQGKTVVTRYLATENRLKAMTEEDILEKLNK